MPAPYNDNWSERVSRQPDETGEYLEGLIRNRTALYEVVIRPAFYGEETGLFLADSRLPKYLDPWVSSDGLTLDAPCRARTARMQRDRSKGILKFTYQYSTMVLPSTRGGQLDPATAGGGGGPGQQGTGSVETPQDLTPNVSYGWESLEEALRVDYTAVGAGGPFRIKNSVGRYPSPLPTDAKPILAITYTRWEQKFPRTIFYSHGFTVNAAVWNGFNPFRVYHPPVTAGPRQEFGGVWWRSVQYIFKCHPGANGWDYLLTSMDTHEKNAAGLPVPILDPLTGQATSEQWPIDAAGKVIRDLSIAVPATFQFITVHRSDFDLLNIDLAGEFL